MLGWNNRLGWCKLSHVCQRWRHLIYASTFHMDMHIECINGTPIVNTLDHLPPLPLVVKYIFPITEQDELGIYHALRLHGRIRHINLHLPPSMMQQCLVLMDTHFPMLEYLSLSFEGDKFTTLTLPKAFLAPNLRHLDLPAVSPPKRLRLLTSSLPLVTLVLKNIKASSYFRPRVLVARLRSLPQLEELSIQFSIPIPRPSAEWELSGEQVFPVPLLTLKKLCFVGVSSYLESLVAQIWAPRLTQLDITLFNQIIFALPRLSHLINIMQSIGPKFSAAEVFFRRDEVSVTMPRHASALYFSLHVRCVQLDWQIDCAAQICGALSHELSGVKEFRLNIYDQNMPTEWQNGEIDPTTWYELLRPFIGAKELQIHDGLLEELSRALRVEGRDPGFLPNLQYIIAGTNLFTWFLDTRVLVGRPVRFSLPPGSPLVPDMTIHRHSSAPERVRRRMSSRSWSLRA